MASSVYWTTITDPDGSKKSGFIQDGRTYYAEGGEIKSGASVTGANGKTYTKGGSSSGSASGGPIQQATGKTLGSGGKYSVDDQGNMWYSVGGQQYNMSAPGESAYKNQTQDNSYLEELRKAQAAAEEAERQKVQNNINLINQQMQSIGQQTTDQKSDIYTTSRLGAVQNAERQAALGLGGGVYSDAPSGYAESVRLRQDSDLRNSLNAADQAALDAQRTLENMKTNAATTGESDINAVTSQYAQLIAEAKQAQAQQELEQMWKTYESERDYSQQQWENAYKQSALDADIEANKLSQALDRAQAEYTIYGKIVSPDLITLLGGDYVPSTSSATSSATSNVASKAASNAGNASKETQAQSVPIVQNGVATGLNLLTNAALSNAVNQSDTEQQRINYLVSRGITNETQIRNILANWEGYSRNWGLNF